MVVRVVDNGSGQMAHGAMSCDGVPCEGESWVSAERIVSIVGDDDTGLVTATVIHPSGDVFVLEADYSRRLEVIH